MRVSRVTTYLVAPLEGTEGPAPEQAIGAKNWLFVRVDTDEGIHGWGEAYTQRDRDRAIEAHIHALSRYLVGQDPFAIRRFTTLAYTDFAFKRGGMDLFCAVSALEMALWDIVGKAVGQPVYNLLGGPCRERIRVYANGWSEGARTPEELAVKAMEVVGMGFSALKFDPFPGPFRLFPSPRDEDVAMERVRAVREAIGPEVELLIEGHRRFSPVRAVQIARRLEEFRPFWFEEPVAPENLDALAEVRRRSPIPIVTGEALYTKPAFREALEKGAADILNPDVANCGGVLELREIGAMAEPYYVAMAPHNYNSTTIALAATVQVCATLPNFLITEYFVNFRAPGDALAREPLRVKEGGYIPLPRTPGLGLELDEEALLGHPGGDYPPRPLWTYPPESP